MSLLDAPGAVVEDSETVSDGSTEGTVGRSGCTPRRVGVHGTQDDPGSR